MKRILLILAIIVCTPVVALVVFLFVKYNSELTNTIGRVDFDREMPIPRLAESVVEPNGTRVFDLTVQASETKFFDDLPTKTWGVNGTYLGPTIRAARGETVRLTVRNSLPETTTMHWHGMHLPAQMDGGPHQPIEPGETWSPTWRINQPAATLWYHPHPHGQTEKHIYRGVAGMFIVDDPATPLGLPHTYGVDDLPVIIQDKKFDDKRQLVTTTSSSTGIIGNEVLVNGARTPHVNVSTEKVRLRLLNGSSARIYNLGLSNGQALQLVGTDGGLLEKPVSLQRLRLSPGERAEVVISIQPGERVVLQSHATPLKSGFLNDRAIGGDDSLDILQLRANTEVAPSPDVPTQLATLEPLPETQSVKTRKFVLGGLTINDKKMDMDRVDFSVTKDTTEIWEIQNLGGSPHNFHVHDVQFRVLDIDGSAPPPELTGWKDTLLLLEGETARLIMKFADYSDPSVAYMFHCHLTRHEDQGMMGQFLVLEPGQEPAPKHDETSQEHNH